MTVVRRRNERGEGLDKPPHPWARDESGSVNSEVSHPIAPTSGTDAPRSRSYDYEIVLVTYRSRALVEEMLDRLPADLPVVIADNAHGVDGLDELAATRPAVRYLDGPGRGYASGVNLAARSSRYPYLVFANPDSSPTVEQFDALVGDVRADPGLAVSGATTLLPDGRVELGAGGWEPTFGRAVVHAVGLHKLFPKAGLWARPTPGEPIELDWQNGACMAIQREVFLELGGFDESYFLYNDDVAFGRTIREAGLRQLVRTDLLVPHLGAGSGVSKTRMLQQRGASLVTYVRRYNPWYTAVGVRVALTLGSGPRWVLSRLRGRPEVAAEHAAYVRGMWLGAPDLNT